MPRSPYAHALRTLRVVLPPAFPVEVRRVKMAHGDNGDCELVRRKCGPVFRIRVSKDLSPESQAFVLIHEWAHAISWGTESDRIPPHGPEFGLAYSRVYQAVFGR